MFDLERVYRECHLDYVSRRERKGGKGGGGRWRDGRKWIEVLFRLACVDLL